MEQLTSVVDGIGWKFCIEVRGNWKPMENRHAFFPRMQQAFGLIPMVMRIVAYTFREWWNGRGVFIDIFRQMNHDPYTGVPIGGIGGGSIGTDVLGGFNKFSLIPGIKEQSCPNIKANQFILTVHNDQGKLLLRSLLSAAKFKSHQLSSWKTTVDRNNLRYRGLFPRAWREFKFPELDLTLICEQLSPVLPNDYLETSLPACLFKWTIINDSSNDYEVTISFTWRNGTGNEAWDRESCCRSFPHDSEHSKGMCLDNSISGMPVTYAVMAEKHEGTDISLNTFDPSSNGKTLWNSLGTKENPDYSNLDVYELGIAVSASQRIASAASATSTFSLAWHMPLVQFGGRKRSYKRRYCRIFPDSTSVTAAHIADFALKKMDEWRQIIENWQTPIVSDNILPEWYRSALFNELYYVVDGSVVWFEWDDAWEKEEAKFGPEAKRWLMEYGRFGYMESWEYYMLNTYDVHFYASWALLKNWPALEMAIQLDFEGDPWLETNAYILHDSGEWKDLNLKFVLLSWRNWKMIASKELPEKEAIVMLNYLLEKCDVIMRRALQDWNPAGDGMIRNGGFADQTYDIWTMTGVSAYCGCLWLAALSTVEEMAERLGAEDKRIAYRQHLDRASTVFTNTLWNGRYISYEDRRETLDICKLTQKVQFDENESNMDVVMVDQLAGQWHQTLSKSRDVIDKEKVTSSLNTIFEYNLKQFADGNLGPVNGFRTSGKVDDSSIQSEEVWIGTAYAYASFLIAMGQRSKGFESVAGLFDSIWNKFGLQYQTPEAIFETSSYRAIGYMRPLAIWAMQHALEAEK